MKREWRFPEKEVRLAVAASMSFAETLRKLGLCPTGGNWKTLRRYTREHGIPTDHFDPYASSRGPKARIPIAQILVEGSTYSRNHLKARLYDEGLKLPVCELCGQGEEWLGRRLAMILDHINGVRDDNRIENLRIVCPNCAATFDTHCGRKNRMQTRLCARCGKEFQPRYGRQKYCSRYCAMRYPRKKGPDPSAWKVARPSHELLLRDRRDELVGRRQEVRSVGQRGAQVGPIVRAAGGDDGLSLAGSTMPPHARPDRGPPRRG